MFLRYFNKNSYQASCKSFEVKNSETGQNEGLNGIHRDHPPASAISNSSSVGVKNQFPKSCFMSRFNLSNYFIESI